MKTGDKLIAYGCVYGNNALMLKTDCETTAWENNRAVLSAEIDITDETDINSIKFMLWDSGMRPIINKVKCK